MLLELKQNTCNNRVSTICSEHRAQNDSSQLIVEKCSKTDRWPFDMWSDFIFRFLKWQLIDRSPENWYFHINLRISEEDNDQEGKELVVNQKGG